jgi:hypothetical protein
MIWRTFSSNLKKSRRRKRESQNQRMLYTQRTIMGKISSSNQRKRNILQIATLEHKLTWPVSDKREFKISAFRLKNHSSQKIKE